MGLDSTNEYRIFTKVEKGEAYRQILNSNIGERMTWSHLLNLADSGWQCEGQVVSYVGLDYQTWISFLEEQGQTNMKNNKQKNDIPADLKIFYKLSYDMLFLPTFVLQILGKCNLGLSRSSESLQAVSGIKCNAEGVG